MIMVVTYEILRFSLQEIMEKYCKLFVNIRIVSIASVGFMMNSTHQRMNSLVVLRTILLWCTLAERRLLV